jgi:hypothetical protein
LLHAASSLSRFYEEQGPLGGAHIGVFLTNLDMMAPLCISPLLARQLVRRDIPPTFVVTAHPMFFSGDTFLLPPTTCTSSEYVSAVTNSLSGDLFQMAPAVTNDTTFDEVRAQRVAHLVEQAFIGAVEETFEDGVRSKFEKTLASLIHVSGNDAMKAIERVLESPNTNEEIAGESLRRIGEVQDEESQKYRLNVLKRHLRSPSPRLRYAAALGLASMDDPKTIPVVAEAMDTETQPDVRRSLRQVLEQLQETERCRGT